MIIPVEIGLSGIAHDGLLGGQVRVGDGDISRALEFSCIGDLDTNELQDTEVTATYKHGDADPVTVFVGPMVEAPHAGSIYQFAANDRAHWGLAPYRVKEPFTIDAGTTLGAAVNRIAEEMGLSTSATASRTLKIPLSVERGAEPWKVIKDLCASANRLVFFDHEGELVIRRKRNIGSGADWSVDDATELLSEPLIRWDTKGYRDGAEVIGNLPCGEVLFATAGEVANGRWAVELIETEDVEDQSDAQDLADDTLQDFTITDVGADFTAIPNPSLELWDKVEVMGMSFQANTFTIPLNGTGSMSVGTHKRVRRNGWRGF